MTPDLLVIMARYPTRGRVKTRLAREIGARAATDLYRHLLAHLAEEFARAPLAVEWRYTPARAPFRRLIGDCGFTATPQPDGDLGERMRRIFEESFARGHRRVIIIGTDAPAVDLKTVRAGFRLLKKHPAVFQPTFDGGYALVGLTRPADIFSGIAWSTARVMAQTRARLRALRLDAAELPPTFDVDTAADLAHLERWERQTGHRLTATATRCAPDR